MVSNSTKKRCPGVDPGELLDDELPLATSGRHCATWPPPRKRPDGRHLRHAAPARRGSHGRSPHRAGLLDVHTAAHPARALGPGVAGPVSAPMSIVGFASGGPLGDVEAALSASRPLGPSVLGGAKPRADAPDGAGLKGGLPPGSAAPMAARSAAPPHRRGRRAPTPASGATVAADDASAEASICRRLRAPHRLAPCRFPDARVSAAAPELLMRAGNNPIERHASADGKV